MSGLGPTIIDARGLACPEPLVMARRALRRASAGARFELLASDPLAPLDIEALCARGACVYRGCHADEQGLRIRFDAPA